MNLFRLENFSGRLLSAEPEERSRYTFIVWFPYTRELVNAIQEGDLFAIPNFQSEKDKTVYSIVKATRVLPRHFALKGKQDTESYPGYVMEAAKNIAASWINQEREPLEDTTIIEIEAVPTNLQFSLDNGKPQLEEEKNLPMVGEEVRLVSQEFMTCILNASIKLEYEDIIEIGHLTRDKNIKVMLRVDDLIKTHFGVFGFTGVGKSNLISTLIRKLMTERIDNSGVKHSTRNIKIILFDLMDEYTALLIDLLTDVRVNSKLIFVGRGSLTGPTFDFLCGKSSDIDKAVSSFVNQMHMPKRLLPYRNNAYANAIKQCLENKRIRIVEREMASVHDLINEIWPNVVANLRSPMKLGLLEKLRSFLESFDHQELTPEVVNHILNVLGAERSMKSQTVAIVEEIEKQEDLKQRIDNILIPYLRRANERLKEKLGAETKITIQQMIDEFNDVNSKCLYIITGSDSNTIREFGSIIGDNLYNYRRLFGLTIPLVLFIFDEADEIVPQSQYIYHDSQNLSKRIVETIARRGRKFGIGVGISTQRSAYLDTNIMGQLHTYFISKLPREYDRNVVAEAFGLPNTEMIQTFKFKKGEWLLVSHEATGIESIPFPIYAENAETKIEEFLKMIGEKS
jgi:DNA helicase HerA-like ATPase